MKFSFEAGQHRDELAQEVMSKDKSERRAFSEQQKQTLEYKLASHIRDFERGSAKSAERRRGEEFEIKPGMSFTQIARRIIKKNEYRDAQRKKEQDDTSENQAEKVTKQEVIVKDSEGKEHLIELVITNISDQIPESVKIIYDMHRLLEIESTIDDPEMVRGWGKREPDRYRKISFQNRDFRRNTSGDLDQNFRIVRKYVEMTNRESGIPLLQADGLPIDEAGLKIIAQQATEEFKVFRSQVTEGLVDNPNVFYHTIGAYTEGWNGDNSRSAGQSLPKETIIRSLAHRFPHKTLEGEVSEEPIEIGQNLQSHELWVHAGELIYDSMIKPLMMLDGSSEKFRRGVRGLQSLTKGKFAGVDNSGQLKDALEFANTKNEWGALMIFKKGATPWLLVADQIFDPYHGRLIKIKEKPMPLPSEEVNS